MNIKSLAICAVLALATALPMSNADEPNALQAKIAKFEAENAKLREEVQQAQRARLNAELRLLEYLSQHLDGDPSNWSRSRHAMRLASRLAQTQRGNGLIWRVLFETEVLRDGMSLADAETLLGPPTETTDAHVGWYFNPHGRHVAPFVRANRTDKGLEGWAFGNR